MALGRHVVADITMCNFDILNDKDKIKELLQESVVAAGATELFTYTRQFDPIGVTGVSVLAESHITIHTWPELGIACVDAFTCGEHTDPGKAIEHLAKRLGGTIAEATLFQRGESFNFSDSAHLVQTQ